MPNLPEWSIAWVVAYFVGSIPFGFMLARAKGVDIRLHGSGNIGATNVGRVLGRRLGLLCFILDVLKGLLPSLGAGLAMGVVGKLPLPVDQTFAWLGVAAASIAGHMFPVWLRFKGGKGVATGLGAMAGIFPVLTIAAAGAAMIWVASAKLTRYVGISSCIAAVCMPLFTWIAGAIVLRQNEANAAVGVMDAIWPYLVVTCLLAVLVVYRHRGNIRRTLAGTEMKIGQRARPNLSTTK